MKKSERLIVTPEQKKFLCLLVQAYRLKFVKPTSEHWKLFNIKGFDAVDAAELHEMLSRVVEDPFHLDT